MLWLVSLSPDWDVRANLKAVEAYNGGIRMLFTENVGQLSNEVVFYSMHPSVVYVLKDGTIHINGVRVSFGAKPRFITGDMPLITKISYFGRNKAISDIPTYRRVVLKEVYPKIDAILTADGRGVVEMQFIVRPGGDPGRIRVETDGEVKAKGDGLYIVKDGKEVVRVSNLKAYQGTEEVEVRAVLSGNTLRFEVGEYNRRHTLVIDPIATAILTSSERDVPASIAMDGSGNLFVAGWTCNSSDFAPSRTVFGTPSAGVDSAAFVSKLSSDLSTHIATAILTSSGNDAANSIVIDGAGNVFVAGYTANSSSFGPSRTVFGTPGYGDAFVSKLSNDLSSHIATAILTSSSADGALSMVIDNSGNVLVSGVTYNSGDFAPSRTVFGTLGGADAFVSKLSGDLSTHIATAILTSSSDDGATSMAIDGSGNVFVAGETWNSNDFALSRIVFGTPGGYKDAFVSKLSGDLSTHIATAILTSSNDDEAWAVAVDGSGNVFVAGRTYNSGDFAPSRTVFGSPGGEEDVFVSKLSNDLSSHIATAILTGSDSEGAWSVAVDGSGNVFVVGYTGNSSDFAPSRVVFGTPAWTDAFVSKLGNDLSTHLATAILTSSDEDMATHVFVDGSGSVFVAGRTRNSGDFAPSRTVFGTPGYWDAFVSKLPNSLDVSEVPGASNDANVEISKGVLILTLPISAYVGFDVYLANGRLIKRVSLGYLPAGKYEYRLKLPRGAYLFKVRIGDEVREIKGVM